MIKKIYTEQRAEDKYSEFLEALDMNEKDIELIYPNEEDRIRLYNEWKLNNK